MATWRVLVIQLDHADPPGRLRDWLAAADVEVDVCDVAGGAAVPAAVDPQYGGLVVLGGKMSTRDDTDYPWLADVRALLRGVVRDEVPTLAICLGAQLLAAAHGGRVIENPEGPELGAQLIAKRSATATDPLFGPLPITPDVIQWHYDTIATLPAAAIQLASSVVCENQAFRLGRLAWGIQWHIETTPEMITGWAWSDAAQLAEDYPGLDLDLRLRRAIAALDDLAEVWPPFVRSFAEVVADPDSVTDPRGPRVSTAEPVTDPAAIRAALAAEANAGRMNPLPMPVYRRPDE